jgi:hypothetical protein
VVSRAEVENFGLGGNVATTRYGRLREHADSVIAWSDHSVGLALVLAICVFIAEVFGNGGRSNVFAAAFEALAAYGAILLVTRMTKLAGLAALAVADMADNPIPGHAPDGKVVPPDAMRASTEQKKPVQIPDGHVVQPTAAATRPAFFEPIQLAKSSKLSADSISATVETYGRGNLQVDVESPHKVVALKPGRGYVVFVSPAYSECWSAQCYPDGQEPQEFYVNAQPDVEQALALISGTSF